MQKESERFTKGWGELHSRLRQNPVFSYYSTLTCQLQERGARACNDGGGSAPHGQESNMRLDNQTIQQVLNALSKK